MKMKRAGIKELRFIPKQANLWFHRVLRSTFEVADKVIHISSSEHNIKPECISHDKITSVAGNDVLVYVDLDNMPSEHALLSAIQNGRESPSSMEFLIKSLNKKKQSKILQYAV